MLLVDAVLVEQFEEQIYEEGTGHPAGWMDGTSRHVRVNMGETGPDQSVRTYSASPFLWLTKLKSIFQWEGPPKANSCA